MRKSLILTIPFYLLLAPLYGHAHSIHEMAVVKPFKFPGIDTGQTAEALFQDGVLYEALPPEKRRQDYCLVIGTGLKETLPGQIFAVEENSSLLDAPYRSFHFAGELKYGFAFKALNKASNKFSVLDVEVTTANADPAKVLAMIKTCLGPYFEIR